MNLPSKVGLAVCVVVALAIGGFAAGFEAALTEATPLAFSRGHTEGKKDATAEFQAEAKKRGFAWHSREDGRWCWKTYEEVLTTSTDITCDTVALQPIPRK